jgi:adenylate cyclase
MRKKKRAKISAEEPASRRKFERLAIELPVLIEGLGARGGSKEQTRTLDLSRAGASFLGRHNYRAGMALRVSFPDLPNRLTRTRGLPAQVVRVNESSPGREKTVAVRFKDLNAANLAFSELLRTRMRITSALLDLISAISPGTDIGLVMVDIRWAAERALEAEKALLFLRDRQTNTLSLPPHLLHSADEVQVPPGKGLVGWVAEKGKSAKVPRLMDDPRYRPELERYFDTRTHSVLCIPFPKEEGVSPGVLVAVNKRYGTFTQEDEVVGTAIANQTAAVLREARLFENIRGLKNYYERILESVATGILTFDLLGNLTTVNRAGTDIFGFRPKADVSRGFRSLFDNAANSRWVSLTEDVLKGQRGNKAFDVRFLRGDGTNLSLNVNALPMQDAAGDSLGTVLVAEDITHEQRLMNTLCRYMAREVAEQVMQEKSKGELGGKRIEVAILMTDIRNFTTMSEQMDPWDIVALLNDYFPSIINVIFRHQGMVDKFIGDSILAVFGVPSAREDDALRAARAALEMREQLQSINRERRRKKLRTIEMGIGITSGTVISGNIGSERRMDFTVIGDPVNLAARLEGLTKEVKRKVLVSDQVRAVINKEIPCEALGDFAVKGKQEKVPVFAISPPEDED